MAKSVDVLMESKLVENEKGNMVQGCQATCGQCGHKEQSFGDGIKSQKRCLALLRRNCPEGESNYYVDPDSDEDDD